METNLICTSNNRLTCTINLILDKAGIDITNGWVYDNGTVIKIEGLGETSKITMIHPDECSEPKRFVSKHIFNEKFKDELPIPMPLNKKTYLVRHGHAGHNVQKATLEESHDASLTSIGKTQARNSSIAILKDSGGFLPNLKLKSSDLIRTMETIEVMCQEIPDAPNICEVTIESRENSRPIGGLHHWKRDDPLTEISIDPTVSIDKKRLLAPDKSDLELERMFIENTPKNDPIKCDTCIKNINSMMIDWSVYKEKITKGYEEGKTFGQIACQKTLFDIIFDI